jgi:hypothetical protein
MQINKKNPLSSDNGFLSGELGTRTPDPLRVMQDDFLIFRAINRILEAICYRSATNDYFYPLLNFNIGTNLNNSFHFTHFVNFN